MTDIQEALAAVNCDNLQPAPAASGADNNPGLGNEALAALDSVKPAPEKFPAGATLVAVTLERDEATSNTRISLVGNKWRTVGLAVAVRGGKIIAANPVFGRWTNSEPKISACHYVTCPKCGKLALMPDAVWAAKDVARAAGVKDEAMERPSGWEILTRWGRCECGSRWEKAVSYEAEKLQAFTDAVRKCVSEMEKVGRFIPPRFFTIRPVEEAVDLGPEWVWLRDALGHDFKAAVPYTRESFGPVVVFNPGRWLGWVENCHDTQLFFEEKSKEPQRSSFNPKNVVGL